MKNVFCTISTLSHLYKCFALAESINAFGGILEVLLVDQRQQKIEGPANINFTFLENLTASLEQSIINKYEHKPDCLRWSLKAPFILRLLEKEDKVIYVDNDILFFSDPSFLFEALDSYNVLLTPHYYPRNPESNQNWFEANFRVGLYNAGFLAANKEAKEVLVWWAKACLYRCEKNYWRGLFDDQKYLDLVPIMERKTKVLDHLGCNVAAWNKDVCEVAFQDHHFTINQNTPLVFYHFNNYSLQNLKEEDPLFKYYYETLKKYNSPLALKDLIPAKSCLDKVKLFIWTFLNTLNAR